MFRKIIKLDAFKKFGVESKIPRESAVIDSPPLSGHFVPIFLQVDGFLQTDSIVDTLNKFLNPSYSEINEFLDGKPFLIDDCFFDVKSYRNIFPTENDALKFAKLATKKDSPYIEILNFFDESDSPDFIDACIIDDTCKISDYKIDKDATSRQKASFTIHFALKIQLRKKIQGLSTKNFQLPTPIPWNIRFYNVLKTVLDHPGLFYIDEQKRIRMKSRNMDDCENAFLYDLENYLGNTSFLDYFRLLQNELIEPKWKEKLRFFNEYTEKGFVICGKRISFEKMISYQQFNLLYVDFPLKIKSSLLKNRLEGLLKALEIGGNKILAGRDYLSGGNKDLCLIFQRENKEPENKYIERRNEFMDGLNSLKDGILSALQYLEIEVWGRMGVNPMAHLGKMCLKTMLVDPVMFAESEIPVLRDYSRRMISGTLLET